MAEFAIFEAKVRAEARIELLEELRYFLSENNSEFGIQDALGQYLAHERDEFSEKFGDLP